ncbi:KH domain-containing protein [Candidatus Woesearchaeota archaeon]|nr:KH domain-containing protein [Candidatus Woesearchaeota archaeon]
MEEFMYELRIPKERIAVLIGKNGEAKKELEEDTKTKIKIDSKEGDVFISGKDALGLYTARELVKAVGRGFNPEIAKLLLKQDFILEIIEITEYTNKSKNTMVRLKGRVIGKEGKSRKIVEELTESCISVYGKTISIIGPSESVNMARQAVISLLRGSTHANVYKWLEKKRRELKRKETMEI